MSIFSTYVSSISYIGNPGKAFASDWNPFVFGLGIPIASYFAAKYFVPFYRNNGSVSAYAFLEDRFGPWARYYASACYLLTQMARMGSILYLLAMPMNVLMGWDLQTVIIITSIAIILYSMLGGMKAVIWTEAIQGFILIGGALVCLLVLLFSMPEGPAQTFEIGMNTLLEGTDRCKFSLGSFSLTNLGEATFWVWCVHKSPELWYRPELRAALSYGKNRERGKECRTLRRLALYPSECCILYDRNSPLCILSGDA